MREGVLKQMNAFGYGFVGLMALSGWHWLTADGERLALHHRFDAVLIERQPSLVEVADLGEGGADSPQAQTPL